MAGPYMAQVAVTVTTMQWVQVPNAASDADAQVQAVTMAFQPVAFNGFGSRATLMALYTGSLPRPDNQVAPGSLPNGPGINQQANGTIV
jgi:hypothetical protein